MPGNDKYYHLLNFIMPDWDSEEIDVEFRNIGIVGMQRTGKTTLATTIGHDLYRKYGADLVILYGYWLHEIIPRAREQGLLKGKSKVVLILDDATAFQNWTTVKEKLGLELRYYWRIAHHLKDAGIRTNTAKVAMIYLYHSYMLVSKFMRNAHAIIVKTMLPSWQRFEHEDITLRWFDNAVVKELTRLRFSSNVNDVMTALNSALAIYVHKGSDIIKYNAVKEIPPCWHFVIPEPEVDKSKDEERRNNQKLVKAFSKAMKRLIDEFQFRTKVDKSKYLRIGLPKDGIMEEIREKIRNAEDQQLTWISLGPIAPLLEIPTRRRRR